MIERQFRSHRIQLSVDPPFSHPSLGRGLGANESFLDSQTVLGRLLPDDRLRAVGQDLCTARAPLSTKGATLLETGGGGEEGPGGPAPGGSGSGARQCRPLGKFGSEDERLLLPSVGPAMELKLVLKRVDKSGLQSKL